MSLSSSSLSPTLHFMVNVLNTVDVVLIITVTVKVVVVFVGNDVISFNF
jgi:hypothetical protein